MFNDCKKFNAVTNYTEEDDYAGERFSVIWERYNPVTGEVEETLEIEPHDADGLEAVEKLADVKKPDGEWRGNRYVYNSDGVMKHIRPVNCKE
ncbi:MAG: hypothetical protein PHY67_02555 [Methanocorpusculum sp.]|nr:hypothetical protein [Methanocorpusculum sp.]